jgi:hypothetical protein
MAPMGRFALAAVAAAAMIALAGCGPSAPMPTPTSSTSKTPTPTATKPPELNKAGSAEDNFEYFEYIVDNMAKASGMKDGASMLDTLVAAGFDKADMEVTPNVTAIGELVDSVIFSVRFNGECLIGQVFQSWEYTVTRAPVLGTGKCLVGATRPIDF